ncbi:hypothetical protein [Streptomyces sp. NPDC058766]|uniref:Rv1733c family protein n=1 Tax=Streptomyces sp. NPDC058766 TaxID=3346630 RepID=UPI00368860E0
MRAISGLWRWRRNPLCRTTDLAEAWLAFAAFVLILVAAQVTGSLVGTAAQEALQRSVRAQHEARHPVTAAVVRKLDRPPLDADPETSTGTIRTRVLADWTAPDGTSHRRPVFAGLKDPGRGDTFRIWTDDHGRTVARPLDPATASTYAVLAGFGAALAAGGLVEGGRRLVVRGMLRRRYTRWDQAWHRAGPDWGRTGTGS